MGAFELTAALTHAIPALVWLVIAESSWKMVRSKRSESRFFWLLPVVAGGIGLTYAVFTFVCLLPDDLRAQRPLPVLLAYAVHDVVLFVMVASARHMSWYFPTPETTPSRAWIVVNYGSAILMGLLGLVFLGLVEVPGIDAGFQVYPSLRIVYQLIMIGLIVRALLPIMRPGGMSAGVSGWIGVRRADAVFLIGAMVTLAGWLVVAGSTSWETQQLWQPTPWGVFLDALVGFGFAAPLAMRFLGQVVRNVLVILVTALAAAGVMFAAVPATIAAVGQSWSPLVNLAALVALIVVFVPGRGLVLRMIDGFILNRSRQRRDELHAFLQQLSPEHGAAECCRRALAELTRVMRLRGVALFLRDREPIVHGHIDIAGLLGLQPELAQVHRSLLSTDLRETPTPLREVLTQADIVGVVPVTSPRHRWGVLLLATDLLGATFSDEDERALRGFADQLALLLDGAELLASALEAQRSLAHAEKLAAVGELAARVAHEIRNPVTAARSLAQQLCRDPASPLNAEHAGLIVEEMERVEKRIAALLQYARKDELRREPVDLSELAQGAGRAFAARFEEANIAFECRTNGAVPASVDRERLRQVLVNLMENAVDALATQEDRRLCLQVSGADGSAEIRVTDNGPGVSAEAMGRLFEPFFSLKAKGTGLGLAIAKRIVEAHGGELRAELAETGGLAVVVTLPREGAR